MRGGLLRKRVTIERDTPTKDGAGGETSSWNPIATRWAAIETLTGSERFTTQQEASEATVRIRMRYDATTSGVTTKDRIVYGSRIFDIENPANRNERNRELVLMCKERHV